MRGIGPMHGSHDEHENQTEGNCQTFLICHVIYRVKKLEMP
jgi:hypothetical protein